MASSESLTVADYNTALFGSSDARAIATPVLIQQMLDSGQGISDLVFSPGRPPQVERFGELTPVPVEQLPSMRPADTAGLARDLIQDNLTVLRRSARTGRATFHTRCRIAAVSASTCSGSAAPLRS